MNKQLLAALLFSLIGHTLLLARPLSFSFFHELEAQDVRTKNNFLFVSLEREKSTKPDPREISEETIVNQQAVSSVPDSHVADLPFAAGFQDYYFPSSQVDLKPSPETPILIPYPDESIGRGKVSAILLILINKEGIVDDVLITQSNLPLLFEETTINYFKNKKMVPAIKEGIKVNSRLKIEVEFLEELN